MKKLYYLVFIAFVIPFIGLSQVAIGASAVNASAALDIVSSNSGFLMPRMTLAQRTTILSPATGLIVFQTDGTGGYYYYTGTVWTPFKGNYWSNIGNAGTLPATNFIGTTDAQPFIIKTNNAEQMRVLSSGFVGIGTPTPLNKLHLVGSLRIQDGNEGIGKVLVSNALGNTTWKTASSLGIAGWGLTGNTGTTPGTNYLGTVDGQDLVIKTNNTEKARFFVNGNVGINVAAPIAKFEVAGDLDNLAVIKGTNTNTTAGTISYGVMGQCNSTGLGSAGMNCISTSSAGNEIGVLGRYQSYGAGVFGLGYNNLGSNVGLTYMTNLRDYGVYGSVRYPGGFGIYGYDGGNYNGAIPGVDLISYALYGNGKFACTGTKSASVPTTQGNQLVYCAESPEMWFEDLGTSKLVNGSVHIALDDMYMETVFIDDTHKMRIFIQEEGESNGLRIVKDADNKGFTVKEKNGGTSNIDFSYRIMAKRRFYQNQRYGVDPNQPLKDNLAEAKDAAILTTDPEKTKIALANAIAEKEREYRERVASVLDKSKNNKKGAN
jgi:hypothetical protein